MHKKGVWENMNAIPNCFFTIEESMMISAVLILISGIWGFLMGHEWGYRLGLRKKKEKT